MFNQYFKEMNIVTWIKCICTEQRTTVNEEERQHKKEEEKDQLYGEEGVDWSTITW